MPGERLVGKVAILTGDASGIAAGCLDIASDEVSWVTGGELVIDSGLTANR
jgi:hypothetical protein